MLTLPLQLKYGEEVVRPTAAYLVVGERAEDWLAELTSWEESLANALLYVVPRSKNDRRPLGVLVVGAAPRADHEAGKAALLSSDSNHEGRGSNLIGEPLTGKVTRARRGPHGVRPLRYGLVGNRLYLPVEGRLEPGATEKELEAALRGEVLVFHPTAGLIGFETKDALRIEELVAAPSERPAAWDRANAGEAINKRLVSIEPETMPGADEIIEAGQGDIGSEPLDGAPAPDGEPGNDLASRIGRSSMEAMGKAIQFVAGMMSHGGSQPNWVNGLESWAANLANKAAAANEWLRLKELNRMMKLLTDNPEEGLKYALPIGGTGWHRGTATPSNYLPSRNTNFSLGGLGGGGPADFWGMPDEMREKLTQLYRETAEREARLGRYRRAAYIYAHLLGDLHAAANMLVQGKHFREAAILYRDKLHRELEAADLFLKAGLWREAVELYEKLNEFEKAGDVYTKLDNLEQAKTAYASAVAMHERRDDLIHCGRILDEKLHDRRAAIDMLARAWPGSKQVGLCLKEMFRLIGSEGLHDEARTQIIRMRDDRETYHALAALADVYADLSGQYPDVPVRKLAADATRSVVARRLPLATPKEADEILAPFRRLVPEDLLLGRDCQRYVTTLRRQTADARASLGKPAPAKPTKAADPVLVRSFQLEGISKIRDVAPAGDLFYVLGTTGESIRLLRSRFTGIQQETTVRSLLKIAKDTDGKPFDHAFFMSLAAHPRDQMPPILLSSFGGAEAYEVQPFLQHDSFAGETGIVQPAWMAQEVHSICRSTNGDCWAISHDELQHFSPDGGLLSSVGLPASFHNEENAFCRLVMHARTNEVFISIGQYLYRCDGKHPVRERKFDGRPISDLAGSAPFSLTRIAVASADGAYVIWPDVDLDRGIFLEFPWPKVAFTRTGLLVLASQEQMQTFSTDKEHTTLVGTTPGPGERIVAVMPAEQGDEFAIVTESGKVFVYRAGRK